jgi:dihydropteroate synthase
MLFQQTTLNCLGRIVDLTQPKVMGVLNITPDSFFDGGRYHSEMSILSHVQRMLMDGVDFIDIGGMSSRPGAIVLSAKEERKRVIPVIKMILREFPQSLISVDTFRASIAKEAVEEGAVMINDISAGSLDPKMLEQVAALNVPYILMHMQGVPATMQLQPQYNDLVLDILDFLIEKLGELRALGQKDIIIDVGFGFGKSIEDNYKLLQQLSIFKMLELPILVGISRKSMIYNFLDVSTEEALNGTTALHMFALQQGAKILRVHDVKEAKECIKLWDILEQ